MLRALTLALLAAAPAWGGGPLPVVTTSTDLKALVEAVGGDRVHVEALAPPLSDPHAVDVKPGQLAKIKAAALDRKSTRLNSSHIQKSRMPSSA